MKVTGRITKGDSILRIKSIVMGVVIAFAASLNATVALAQQFEYVGPSTTARTGAQGYFTFHNDCDAAFRGATMCTSKMIIEGGPAKFAPTPSATVGEWVNPVIVTDRAPSPIDFMSRRRL